MKGKAANMIHVTVREEDMLIVHRSLRAPPCVEYQLQLRNADAGLLHSRT